MDDKSLKHHSKFLSLVLRHQPEVAGLQLDAQGWVSIETLLVQCRLTRAELDEIVATNAKRRFAISEDGLRIRASQGHSVEVDLSYEASEPPATLFHGTVASILSAIQVQGLQKMARHHVHLSADVETARMVGQRRGKPVVLTVRAGQMHREGHVFFRSANGVWLTDAVPPQYIEFP